MRKQLGVATPVLRLIDEAAEKDIADALLGGADDCMPYPVRVLEFAARVTALTRRGKGTVARERERIEIGSLVVDRKNRLIFRDNEPVPMTPKTYNLAVLLLSNVGQLMSRSEMLHAVWGAAKKGSTRTLDTHVSRLRLALGLLPQHGWQLQSVYQYGYRLDRLEPVERLEQAAA
jgi:DNA-binding response OmpR family regulator